MDESAQFKTDVVCRFSHMDLGAGSYVYTSLGLVAAWTQLLTVPLRLLGVEATLVSEEGILLM